MNKPAANVRKNGRTLFNTPLYNMQFHLLKASINVYGGFSKTFQKSAPTLKVYSITFRGHRKAFCFQMGIRSPKIISTGPPPPIRGLNVTVGNPLRLMPETNGPVALWLNLQYN